MWCRALFLCVACVRAVRCEPLVICLVVVAACHRPAFRPISPVSVSDGGYRDLGLVPCGPTLIQEFTLTNESDRTVALRPDVRTSCGCSDATLSRTQLMPGQQAILKIGISTPRFEATSSGVFAMIGVLEPPDLRPIHCTVKYHCVPQWEVRPPRLRLSGSVGSTAEAEFTVGATSDVELTKHSVEVDSDAYSLTRLGGPADANKARYRVRCKLPETPAITHTVVRVRMPGADVEQYDVPLEVESTSRYRVSPAELLLTSSTSHPRTLVVRGDEAFSLSVDESSSTVMISNSVVTALDDGKANHVEVLLCPDALLPRQDKGFLTLDLVGPHGKSTLRVPVFRARVGDLAP